MFRLPPAPRLLNFSPVPLIVFALVFLSGMTVSAQSLSTVTLGAASVTGGSPITGTVTLTAAAPGGGTAVTLSSSNTTAATVPSSVTVASGSTSATFTITSYAVATTAPVTISGVAGGPPKTAILNVNPTVAASQNPPVQAGNSNGGYVTPAFAKSTLATWTVYDPNGNVIAGQGTGMPGANGWSVQIYTYADVNTGLTEIAAIWLFAPAATQPLPGYLATVAIPTGVDTASKNAGYFDVVPAQPINLQTFSVLPATVTGGAATIGTVTMDSPAPYGGATVALSNSNTSAATAPASVTVPAGSSSQTFSIATASVAGTASATLGAAFNGATMYQQIAVTPATLPPGVVSVTLSPPIVTGTNATTATVTLGAAPTIDTAVALSSNNASATVPATVTVPAGQTSASFTVATTAVSASATANITATYGGSQSAPLTIVPASSIALTSLVVSPGAVPGGISTTGTVTLSGAAPFGGLVVALSGTDPSAAVPATVTVLQGSATANFAVTTTAVSASKASTISAVLSGVTKTAGVTVNPAPPAQLQSLVLAPATVIGAQTNGTNSTGAITLTSPAPSGGVVVALTSSAASVVSVPSTVTVPPGASSVTFAATTFNVTATQSITISAVYNSARQSATLTVNPWLASLALSPASAVGGATTTATVTINAPAPTGGLPVAVASANTAAATIPNGGSVSSGVLTIPAGATSASFTINTYAVTLNSSVNITAAYSGMTLTKSLSLLPLLQSLSLSPTTLTGGTPVTGTVTLNGPAPSASTISLSSNNAAASVPATLTIAAGASSGTFTVTTTTVTSVTSPTITAAFGGVTRTQQFTINPTQVTLALNPATVVGGAAVTGTVTLSGPAPAGGLVVTLSTTSAAVAPVPASVTVAAGATTQTFTITTGTVTATTSPIITAAFGGLSSQVSLTVKPLLASVSLSPTYLVGGAGSTGAITLNAAAPRDITVTLASSNAAAVVPASVVVPSGTTSTTFAITTSAVASSTSATITAAYAGASAAASLAINPLMQSLSLSPSSIYGGGTSTGAVNLYAAAPAGGVTIALSSSNTAAATTPASLAIAAGATSGTFAISTTAVTASSTSSIKAAYTTGSVTQNLSQTLTVNPLLSSVSISPNPLLSSATGTGTVYLSGPAPAGGVTVSLGSSNTAAATVPASVAVTAGSSSATFAITAAAVTAGATTSITATYGGLTRTAPTLTVTPLLSGLSISPGNIVGGDGATATVTFTMAAPAGVTLSASSSNAAAAATPATINVTANSYSVTFPITSSSVTTQAPVTISVAYGGVTKTATLNVYPPPALLSLQVAAPNEVVGGNAMSATVKLTNIAPAAGVIITLSSTNTAVAAVPSSVTIGSGSSQATFTITTIPTAATASSTLTATYAGASLTAGVTVDRPSLSGVTFSPSSLPGGNTTTGTVAINGKAPPTGVSVDLSGMVAGGQNFLPSSTVAIASGQTSTTFQVATSTVNAPTTLTIVAANHAYPTETVSGTISLTLVNLRATDLQMPKAIVLQWGVPAVGHYVLKRDGALVATLPNTTRTYTDIFVWNSAQTYKYDLYDDNTTPMTLLSSEQSVPYIVAATQDQAVDSRLDPRYSTTTYLDFNFGSNAYKGGLFAGYGNDPSRVGRSFARFTLNPPPTGGIYRIGRINAALTSGYSDQGAVSNLKVGCQAVPSTVAGYNTWSAGTVNWDNAPFVTPASATQTVTINYNPNSSPPPFQWFGWNLSTDIQDAILGVVDSTHDGTNVMNVQWASMNEAGYGWAYFAKTEYDPTLGPTATDLWSLPTLVKLTVPGAVNLGGATTGSAAGQLSVNGIGLQGSAVVALTSDNPLVTFQATGTQTYSMTVTGLNNTFTMSLASPSTSAVANITASFGTVTKTAAMTVNH